MTSCAGNAYGFSEIQFRTTAGVALPFSGGTATAAQTYLGDPGTYDATKATDGNTSTIYASVDKVDPQWWAYDFSATSGNWRDVVQISITARSDGSFFTQAPYVFVPEWSDDNSAWTSMAPISTTWASAGQTQVFTVATTDARVTQALAEHWLTTNPDARITQVVAEHWASVASGNLQAVVTQVLLEHWMSVAVVPTGPVAAGGPIVTMIH